MNILNSKIENKFYDLQERARLNSSSSDFISIRERNNGRNIDNGDIGAEFVCDWNEFIGEFSSEDLNNSYLIIDASLLQDKKVRCGGSKKKSNQDAQGWKFPMQVEIKGQFDWINFSYAEFRYIVSGRSQSSLDNGIGFLVKGGADFFWTKFGSKTGGGYCGFSSSSFGDTNFSQSQFFSQLSFHGAIFNGVANFWGSIFKNEADFGEAKFLNKAIFFSTFTVQGIFSNSKFNKGISFSVISAESLNFARAEFSGGSVFLHQEKSYEKKSAVELEEIGYRGSTNEILLKYAVFDAPTIIDLNLKKCPDLSETYLLKKFYIKETWPTISKKEIKDNDEPKFRFLKKYFSENVDHFKEQEYFGYEMEAARLRKKSKLLVFKNKSKFLGKFSKERWELRLFRWYEIHSNYGLSIAKPLKAISISFIVFGFVFFGFFNFDPFLAVTNSFIRTLNPLSAITPKDYCICCKSLPVVLTMQSVINGVLLFLLGLGIRNKFKIK